MMKNNLLLSMLIISLFGYSQKNHRNKNLSCSNIKRQSVIVLNREKPELHISQYYHFIYLSIFSCKCNFPLNTRIERIMLLIANYESEVDDIYNQDKHIPQNGNYQFKEQLMWLLLPYTKHERVKSPSFIFNRKFQNKLNEKNKRVFYRLDSLLVNSEENKLLKRYYFLALKYKYNEWNVRTPYD